MQTLRINSLVQRCVLGRLTGRLFSTSLRSKYFIQTQELQTLLDKSENVKLVNGTWYMPNSGNDAWKEHLGARITQDAAFFDHDEVCDKKNPYPHALPSLDTFTANMKKLDIPSNWPIVCYDHQGMFSVARLAWMLRYFGASNVRILDGGFRKWNAEGRKTFSGE